jgi:hypothetical protein
MAKLYKIPQKSKIFGVAPTDPDFYYIGRENSSLSYNFFLSVLPDISIRLSVI